MQRRQVRAGLRDGKADLHGGHNPLVKTAPRLTYTAPDREKTLPCWRENSVSLWETMHGAALSLCAAMR